jgi:biopolymer transport protein TolR
MKYLLEVCLIALALITSPTPSAAQQMTEGISVRLPVTRHAAVMPAADRADAIIVNVTEDGSMYLGIHPTTTPALAEAIKQALSNSEQKNLYVKSDALTRYASVQQVLRAARQAGAASVVLLSEQQNASGPMTVVPPKGLQVLVGPPFPGGVDLIVMQAPNSGQGPQLKINDEPISWAGLPSRVQQLLQAGTEGAVLIRADGELSFADVVHAIDLCRSAGARIALARPEP